jgi:hypothetical protein
MWVGGSGSRVPCSGTMPRISGVIAQASGCLVRRSGCALPGLVAQVAGQRAGEQVGTLGRTLDLVAQHQRGRFVGTRGMRSIG